MAGICHYTHMPSWHMPGICQYTHLPSWHMPGIGWHMPGICHYHTYAKLAYATTHTCQVGICQAYATTHICQVGIRQAYAWNFFIGVANALLFDALCHHAVLRGGSTALYVHAHWGMYCTQTNELQLHSFHMPLGRPINWLVAYARHIGNIGTL